MNEMMILAAEAKIDDIKGIKGCIFGQSGIGKTSLLWTLDAEKTLFVDLEAGDLSVEGWGGDTIRPRTWADCRDLACFIGGANPALDNTQIYSQAHYQKVCNKFGGANVLDKYETIFIDSITVAARHCLAWCKKQPQAMSEKTGKPDTRGAYGLHGQEMIGWLTQLQHARSKHVWLVGILDEKLNDSNQIYYQLQIDGSKTGLELPGIVDEVITMTNVVGKDNKKHRVLVCQTLNSFGYPAKDRSGRLDTYEAPHLGNLMKKILQKGLPRKNLVHTLPTGDSLGDSNND